MAKAHEAGHSADDNRQGVAAHVEDGTIADRPLEGGPYDEFYVSPEDKQLYGIRSDEECYWARDPEYWMKRGELVNRVKQLEAPERRGGMEGRIILQEGDPVRLGGGTEGDLVLMALPKRFGDKRQSEIDEARNDYESELQLTDDDMYEGYFDTLDRTTAAGIAALKSRMRMEHQRNRQMGLIGPGSPTQGMTYTQAAAFIARTGRQQQVEDTANQLLMGGQHTQVSQEQFAALMTGQKKAMAKGKQVAMGDSGFKRNPNSAVEQAKRRATAQGR